MKIGLATPAAEDAEEATEPKGPGLMDMAGKKAAKGILAAITAGDAAALDAALKAHYQACE